MTPAVRALAWGDRSLFGVDRVKTAADWRLNAELPRRADEHAFDPAATWTLFAGGDILLDRGVYETLRIKGQGADFPFDGGTAEITGAHVLLELRLGPAADASGRAAPAPCAT